MGLGLEICGLGSRVLFMMASDGRAGEGQGGVPNEDLCRDSIPTLICINNHNRSPTGHDGAAQLKHDASGRLLPFRMSGEVPLKPLDPRKLHPLVQSPY